VKKANIHNEDFTNFFQARFSHFNSIKIKPSQPETTLIQQQRRSTPAHQLIRLYCWCMVLACSSLPTTPLKYPLF
jgi:hypothetical protein